MPIRHTQVSAEKIKLSNRFVSPQGSGAIRVFPVLPGHVISPMSMNQRLSKSPLNRVMTIGTKKQTQNLKNNKSTTVIYRSGIDN